jgi:UDP-hydrolysing UDP-N-acetyl-D-glucosamine 2-epimerase
MREIAIVLTARASFAKYETILEHLTDVPTRIYACGGALLARYGGVVDVVRRRFPEIPITEVYSQYEGAPPVTAAKSAGALVTELAGLFNQNPPCVVVIMADRYEVLAAAQAAAYLNIPVAHIQGGERTGSIDDRCRNAISHLVTYHYVSTRVAGLRVYNLTGDWATIKVTGCPSIDIAARVKDDPPITTTELSGSGVPVDPSHPFIFCLQHADTTVWEESYGQMMETLEALRIAGRAVLIQWPNQDPGSEGISKAIRVFRDQHPEMALHTLPNMEPRRFLKLLTQASVVVGNSSVGIRECSYLGVPVVNIGERQHGRERARNVVSVGYRSSEILDAIRIQSSLGTHPASTLYGQGNAGHQIANALRDIQLQRAD